MWVTRTLKRFRHDLKSQHGVDDADALVEVLGSLREIEDELPSEEPRQSNGKKADKSPKTSFRLKTILNRQKIISPKHAFIMMKQEKKCRQ